MINQMNTQNSTNNFSFAFILSSYRTSSYSQSDKGTKFEQLMLKFLQVYPLYAYKFKQIWLWSDFLQKDQFGTGKDIGIDLVALTNDNEYWAIQCKCYDEDAYITKASVDSFLATSSKQFKNAQNDTLKFSHRLWISTTNKWNSEAESIIKNQDPPLTRITLTDLENANINWLELENSNFNKALLPKKQLREHQKTALDKIHTHFQTQDRARMIMACGTGKTFTSLKIAENETNNSGLVLFLVPSIALLGQTLMEWSVEATLPINAICICSDAAISSKKTKNENDEDNYSVEDLALPASTHIPNIIWQFKHAQKNKDNANMGMTVVFSTYQSIEVISKVQQKLNAEQANSCIFDLIICDEAHRTTGVTLKDEDESAFTKVHDNNFLQVKKRLYMTATPRLYKDEAKTKAKEADAILCSMDDDAIYGEEAYRIGFGEAVDKNLLSDYKVLVLTIKEKDLPNALHDKIIDKNNEITADDLSKLVGCINALSKKMLIDEGLLRAVDPEPMRTAVAFCQTIKISKKITSIFNEHANSYYNSFIKNDQESLVQVNSDHIDGTMGAGLRAEKLSWLKAVPVNSNECRILTNVKCLSEGVDVPTLDAVMFLSAKNSEIDVVQSVGRVMRKAQNKKFGYIIIPVVIPDEESPEQTLDKNDRYKVVWTVLNALRAHDDRFDAEVNKIDLNKKKTDRIIAGSVLGTEAVDSDSVSNTESNNKTQKLLQTMLISTAEMQNLQNAIYAKMVQKVGNKRYWEQWAKDVTIIAQSYQDRITRLILNEDKIQQAFKELLTGMQKNINPAVDNNQLIEMLAQHYITKPVFESLFENYSFVQNNPVSIALEEMVNLLETYAFDKDTQALSRFYDSVKTRVKNIDTIARQQVITELYEKFFKIAFPKVVDQLGIVYTPVEVVDFINKSVAVLLKQEFNSNLSDNNVHILDPFTGTGTFITRLIQSGLIDKNALPHKYNNELHANEIVLLAYYIASINIENAYHDAINANEYQSFSGICLTDTFQLSENDNSKQLYSAKLPQNSDRVIKQMQAPIQVIIGNPPYSAGQTSENDNNKNLVYPNLDRRINNTYAKFSTAKLKTSLKDSYIRAIRWASDRIADKGIIAFVSNGSYLDGNAQDGLRKCLVEEFNTIYCFNLRGNQRTSGELSRREGGKIFGSGSRAGIVISFLIKNSNSKNKGKIYYYDIGDYLTREQKLNILNNKDITNFNWEQISPNAKFDWINHRNNLFAKFISIGDKKNSNEKTFFDLYSSGVKTNRDNWVYNFSPKSLGQNMKNMINFYCSELKRYSSALLENKELNIDTFLDNNPKNISWSGDLKEQIIKQKQELFTEKNITFSNYRPFCKQYLYFDKFYNNSIYLINKLFPTQNSQNKCICVSGIGAGKDFSALMSDCVPNLHFLDTGQVFPLYYYEENKDIKQNSLLADNANKYIKKDAISDFILARCRENYNHKVNKEDIFYYVYGILHSKDYKEKFKADLKKMLPRIPLVDTEADFYAFSKAGRELAELHLNYEAVPAYPDVKVMGVEHNNFIVDKIRFKNKDDKSIIQYNPYITISNIPLKAYDYVVNGRSAIEWILDRYQVKIDKDSQIKNDPNNWALEQNKPRYILDLILSLITLSIKSVDIVEGLPKLKFEE